MVILMESYGSELAGSCVTKIMSDHSEERFQALRVVNVLVPFTPGSLESSLQLIYPQLLTE